MSNTSRKFSKFALMSYATVEQIDEVLKEHQMDCKAYAYIEHNRDVHEDGTKKPCHTHIVVYTATSKSEISVRNWFKGCTDEKGERANTFCETQRECKHSDGTTTYENVDLVGVTCYLVHEDKQGNPLPNKYHYKWDDVVSFNLQTLRTFYEQWGRKPKEDNTFEILEALLGGASLLQLARKYGRDFILNYKKYQDLAQVCYSEFFDEKEQEQAIETVQEIGEIAELEKENEMLRAKLTCAGVDFRKE